MQNQEVLWPGPSQLRGWFYVRTASATRRSVPPPNVSCDNNHGLSRVACNSRIAGAGTWFAVLPLPLSMVQLYLFPKGAYSVNPDYFPQVFFRSSSHTVRGSTV